MKICACSSEVCTHWPSPETSRSSSAVRMPIAQNSPAVRSATGMPTRIGPSPGRAGDRHQPAHALRDLIEARPLVIGAVLAEAGDAAIDDARVDLAHALVVDAELVLHVGPEVLDHHVGLFREALKHLEALGVFQIERHRPLVAVQVLEIRTMARAARLLAAGVLHQGVDLDDIGAPVRELPHAGRPGADAGEIEHGEAGQGLRGAREGHSRSPMTK